MNNADSTDSPSSAHSFATIGQQRTLTSEPDVAVQEHPDAHWTARKACALLKVTSSIINALVVHPGGDSSDAALAAASTELMQRAAVLTDAAIALLKVQPEAAHYGAYKNLIRQQAAELVSSQWRMSYATDSPQLTTEQIVALVQSLFNGNLLEVEEDRPLLAAEMDGITAKRVALYSVLPELYAALASFDYFVPDLNMLGEKAVLAIMTAAKEGAERLVVANCHPTVENLIMTSLIEKAGTLYATNYRVIAQRDAKVLRGMSDMARSRKLYDFELTGLPTGHVDAAFMRLSKRMIAMVCDAVPEIVQNLPQRIDEKDEASARHDAHQLD